LGSLTTCVEWGCLNYNYLPSSCIVHTLNIFTRAKLLSDHKNRYWELNSIFLIFVIDYVAYIDVVRQNLKVTESSHLYTTEESRGARDIKPPCTGFLSPKMHHNELVLQAVATVSPKVPSYPHSVYLIATHRLTKELPGWQLSVPSISDSNSAAVPAQTSFTLASAICAWTCLVSAHSFAATSARYLSQCSLSAALTFSWKRAWRFCFFSNLMASLVFPFSFAHVRSRCICLRNISSSVCTAKVHIGQPLRCAWNCAIRTSGAILRTEL
jgi:hypothetical protein